MANAYRLSPQFYENAARKLEALADFIPVRNSIDGKVVDLFRETAATMKEFVPDVRPNAGKAVARTRAA